MPTITFKTKPQQIFTMEGLEDQRIIRMPAIKRHHCDMAAFRSSRKFGGYANSDLFLGMIKRALMQANIGPVIKLNEPLPAGVEVDTSQWMAVVTIKLEDAR